MIKYGFSSFANYPTPKTKATYGTVQIQRAWVLRFGKMQLETNRIKQVIQPGKVSSWTIATSNQYSRPQDALHSNLKIGLKEVCGLIRGCALITLNVVCTTQCNDG